jgi:hypothetical protein
MSKIFPIAVIVIILCGAVSAFGAIGDPYKWQPYSPNISYSFLDSPDKVPIPTKDTVPAGRCTIQGSKSSGWWTFYWGPRANKNITTNDNRMVRGDIIDPMLARMNEEFAYFRDVMGWPPDKRAKNGYRSAIYLYGSGARCSDNQADSTAEGGWQSSDGYSPIVLLSWKPVWSFGADYPYNDRAYQTGGVVHEGIHAILASMTDASGNAISGNVPGWFHEGGNTWLQQQADAQRTGTFGNWADLNGPTFMAPFMPIECYSGWLQDGSFGGPDAQGVDMKIGDQQICTWRTWLGGNQYGNGFPSFLGEWLGQGAIPWIWMNAKRNGTAYGNNKNVLWVIAQGLGEQQTRRLIMEYRAKQATLDLGRWTESARRLINGSHFGQNIGCEWTPCWQSSVPIWKATPYAKTTNDGNGVLTPEPLTLPGWSGANQIPLTVPTSLNTVSIDFMPDTANMTLQIAYRATDGTAVYSEPVIGVAAKGTGTATLRLDKRPVNNVVIAVITSTDYTYKDDNTRKAKYKYKIKIKDGITTASVDTKHFNITNPRMVETLGYGTPSSSSARSSSSAARSSSSMGSTPINNVTLAGPIGVHAKGNAIIVENLPSNARIEVYSLQGKLITTSHSPLITNLTIPIQTKGMYIVKINKSLFRVLVI